MKTERVEVEWTLIEHEDGSLELVEVEPEPEPEVEVAEETQRAFVAVDEPEDEPLIGEVVAPALVAVDEPEDYEPHLRDDRLVEPLPHGRAAFVAGLERVQRAAQQANETYAARMSAAVVLTEQPECRDRRCTEPAADDSRFCIAHRDVLWRVREEIADGNPRRRNRRRGSPPTCCREGCTMPRPRGQDYCDSCMDAGYGEGEE